MPGSSSHDEIERAYSGSGLQAALDIRHTMDMTPQAAQAMIQSTRNQFAIPAEQETARSRQETLRYGIRAGAVVLIAVVILGMVWLLIERKTDTTIILGLVTAVTFLVGALAVDPSDILKRLRGTGGSPTLT